MNPTRVVEPRGTWPGVRTFRRALSPLLLVVAGCGDDPVQPAPNGSGQALRFGALQVGQESRYLFFDCDHYGNPAAGVQTYQPDTLILTVTGRDASGFSIRESLAPGSASRHGATHVPDAAEVYVHRFTIDADTLAVHTTGSSRIFAAPTARFPLAAFTGTRTEFIGWQPDLPYHESMATAYVENHTQLGARFDRLNVLQDNSFMATDGPGYLFAYGREHGLVRFAHYSWWTGSGNGWDILPAPATP